MPSRSIISYSKLSLLKALSKETFRIPLNPGCLPYSLLIPYQPLEPFNKLLPKKYLPLNQGNSPPYPLKGKLFISPYRFPPFITKLKKYPTSLQKRSPSAFRYSGLVTTPGPLLRPLRYSSPHRIQNHITTKG